MLLAVVADDKLKDELLYQGLKERHQNKMVE